MDPIASSSSASPSPAPLPSTDPPVPFKVSTSTPQECLIALGCLCGEDHGTEGVEAILSHHPEIMLSSQSHHHYKMGLLCDSTTRRIKCFNNAVESLRQALALSPNSISFALFHAVLLFKLAQNNAGSYDAVVQECDQALLIENPMEPGEGIVVVAKKSKRQIIVLEGRNRRDKWKRLVEDNSLAEVKAEFEATLRRKRRISGRKAPPNFESPSLDNWLAKKKKNKKDKKVESNYVATISRVRAFWNDKMSVKKKRKLLRIRIEDLKLYLDKNKFRMAKEVLTEAIDYAKVEKIWRFWACSYCGERVFVSDIDTHLMNHLGTLSKSDSSVVLLLPDGAPEWAVDMVENGVWKPVELISATDIMERGFATADWPYVEDSERAEFITRIRATLQLFIAPELNLVLQFLEDLANVCALHCLGNIASEEDIRGNKWFWGHVQERVFFSSDFSALLFDNRLLQEETVEPDIGNAVLTSGGAEDCVADCESDAIVSWLWTEGPTIGEQIRTWTRLREASPSQGMEFYKVVEDEFCRLHNMCERKGMYLRYEKPLENVESLCVDENRKREQISQGYVSLLFERWKELESVSGDDDESEGAAELDIIWSIMKESETDSEIQMAIQRQINRLAQETGLQAGMVCIFDYRFALLLLLKSFMKAKLEDLANKDAAVKSNAAAKALLAELPGEKNTNKGKSKDKKKKKDHIKTKDSEAGGGSEEQVVSPEPDEDVGSSEQQHPASAPVVSSEPNEDVGSSQSGPAPLRVSGIQFGNLNWTDFCQAQSFKK
ncbi:hypothetical protein FH972_009800 [Carpinus fangiana]|uniref:DUF629 domain-containing protein n=1 Tax=Carpinus fangiana TaxID=176857 RepID=A0A660KNA1_9ROSI|nr:hypothetical protein FH972_009800 [Carpinus fangiana]